MSDLVRPSLSEGYGENHDEQNGLKVETAFHSSAACSPSKSASYIFHEFANNVPKISQSATPKA
jgi:hypothetical protein